MKKSDLKTGMVIETSKGERSLVLLGTTAGDIIAGCGNIRNKATWFPFESLTDDLKHAYTGTKIIKVYSTPSNQDAGSLTELGELLWERNAEKAKPQNLNFSIDLKASDKGERKKAVKYLRGKGFNVRKRKNAKSKLNYLSNFHGGIRDYDFMYYGICAPGEQLLTLPRDWDKFVNIVDQLKNK
jgi:hypothetical protein